jgi:predicted nucleic acid-binding protein
MSLIYLDTSVLAKWYLPETGSDAFSAWMQEQTETCISSLTMTEFRCLLARKQRSQLLNPLQVQEVFAQFQEDIRAGQLLRYDVADDHFINAQLLIERLPSVALRTMDALHLSIARGIGVKLLATADIVMGKAARLLDMEVIFFGKSID